MNLVINDRRHAAVMAERMRNDPNIIPPITDPLGSSWDQPSTDFIVIDDTHALMSKHTFEELAEYSCTNPSGVYHGKMWRRHDGSHDQAFLARGGIPEWYLCWYGFDPDPKFVSNNYRKIILV